MITLRNIFIGLGVLAFVFLLYCLGELTGIIESTQLGEFLSKHVAINNPIEPHRYYFLLSLTSAWVLFFCIINISFFKYVSNILPARLGLCTIISILYMLLFFAIWPGMASRQIPLSYNEWPVDFTTFLYQEDGLFETVTAILLLLASIQFYLAGKYATRHLPERQIIFTLFLFSFFTMILMMEEISWGQRIFSWENPEIIKRFNYQQETNLHNIFNPIIAEVERIFSLFISLALLITILYRTRITSPNIRGLFPSDKYFYISILFAISGMMSAELFEEVFAVFLIFYSHDMKNFYSKV
jgi:hypothetical protein